MEEERKDPPEEEKETGAFPWFRLLLIAVIVIETALVAYTAIRRNVEGRELASARLKLASVQEEVVNKEYAIKEKESEITKARRQLEINMQDLSQSRSDKSRLEIEIQERDLEKLKLQLKDAELEKKLRREKQISEYLRRKIVESKKNELVLMKKVEDLVSSKNELEKQMEMAEQQKKEQMLELEGVPLKEVVVTDTGEAPPSLTGTIIIANHEVEPPFVIINLGAADGLSLGDRFAVTKGKRKKKVGSIIVSKLYPQMAVADIDRETTKKKLKKNWKVVSE